MPLKSKYDINQYSFSGVLLNLPLAVVVSNWFFQGMRYMNSYELILKLLIDFFLFLFLVIFLSVPIWLSLICAHTVNWLFNGHFVALLRYVSPVPQAKSRLRFVISILRWTLVNTHSVADILIYGSFSRGQWNNLSDLDVRLVVLPGMLNAIVGALLCLVLRAFSFFYFFPLDIFLVVDEKELAKLSGQEVPISVLVA